MKKDIHPQYYSDAKFTCSCGATLTTGATQEEITVEVCSQCHPFYTGKRKVVDATGRVDRFKKLSQKADKKKGLRKNIKSKEQKRKEKEDRTLEKTIPTKKEETKEVKKAQPKTTKKAVAKKTTEKEVTKKAKEKTPSKEKKSA